MNNELIATYDLILSIATLITSLGAVLVGWRNAGKIHEVHLSLNSRLSQLLSATESAARAHGAEGERMRAETERQELENDH